jgi:hypothetical protein
MLFDRHLSHEYPLQSVYNLDFEETIQHYDDAQLQNYLNK